MLICRAESRIAKTQVKPILQNSKQLELKCKKMSKKLTTAVIKASCTLKEKKERIPYINSHYVC